MKTVLVFIILFFSQQSYSARPLVVLLHGCKQSAQDIVTMTGFDQVAKENDFFLYTPEQSVWMNPYLCWNWFSTMNQERGLVGETVSIVEQVRKIQTRYDVDAKRIYVVGFSAGAGLSLNLIYCFPEVFAGAAVHSGPVYGVARDGVAAKAIMQYGSGLPQSELRQRALSCAKTFENVFKNKKLLVFQGDADEVVNFQNASEIEMQFPGKARMHLFDGLGHQWDTTATQSIVHELGLTK